MEGLPPTQVKSPPPTPDDVRSAVSFFFLLIMICDTIDLSKEVVVCNNNNIMPMDVGGKRCG